MKVFLVFFAGLSLVVGCVSSIPPYPAQPGADPVQMAPFEKNNTAFMVPAGWIYRPPAMDAVEANLGQWSRGAKIIGIECWLQFLSRDALKKIAHAMVNRLQGKIQLEEGPFRIETLDPPVAQPVLEKYLVEVLADGKPTDLVVLIAWKMPSGSGEGRRYAISGVAPPKDKAELEKALIAMLRTLKD